MKYIAHKTEDGRCQSLADHLLGTAKLAEEFGVIFDAGPHAKRTGLLHDVGKYSADVQERMQDPEHTAKVNHTSAGAIEAYNMYKDFPAAFAIAGHHGGLQNRGSGASVPQDGTFYGKLKYSPKDYSQYKAEIHPEGGMLLPEWAGQNSFGASFYTRMLYSCLTDADYLDTEAFMNEYPRDNTGADMETLRKCLYEYISGWGVSSSAINKRRSEILEACKQAGKQEQGLFSESVPTGGGKTVSSLAFALEHAVKHHLKRIIYVIPYTGIIEQTAGVFEAILGRENVLEHHSNRRIPENNDETTRDEELATENWDMPVIVTTAVQFFESLFSAHSARCRKLHNIAGSVIIFDEAQTIPLPYLIPCVRVVSELIKHYCVTALLCTATQPALDELFLKNGIVRKEIIAEPEKLYNDFRRVNYINEGTMEMSEIGQRLFHEHQALCIVNRKKTAKELYTIISRDDAYCLTTLLTPNDRKKQLAGIREALRNGDSCIVISTSLIEAGVDVDFPTVWREENGLDSIIQSAGRCNREGKRNAEESIVHIFNTSQIAPPQFHNRVEAWKSVSRRYQEIDCLEAVKAYFSEIMLLAGRELDRKEIIRECELFNFRTVEELFSLIDTDTVDLYIPNVQNNEWLNCLRRGQTNRKLIRLLQQDMVQIYPYQYQSMVEHGKIEVLPNDINILADPNMYSIKYGLQLDAGNDDLLFI